MKKRYKKRYMNMKKTMLLPALSFAVVFLFSGCSLIKSQPDVPEEQDEVVAVDSAQPIAADITEYQITQNETTGETMITGLIGFKNCSDKGVMDLYCTLSVTDESGNVLASQSVLYSPKNSPIAPGKTVVYEVEWQEQLGSNPLHPLELQITVDDVLSEEVFSAHLPQPGETLSQALLEPRLTTLEENPPTVLELWIDQEGASSVTTLTDPQEIREAAALLMNVAIKEESQEWTTDHYNHIQMTFADGEQLSISLNQKALELSIDGQPKLYELEDLQPFWTYMSERAEAGDTDEEAGS